MDWWWSTPMSDDGASAVNADSGLAESMNEAMERLNKIQNSIDQSFLAFQLAVDKCMNTSWDVDAVHVGSDSASTETIA